MNFKKIADTSFKQTCSFLLHICLSVHELLLPPDFKGLKMTWNIMLILAYHSQKASLVF